MSLCSHQASPKRSRDYSCAMHVVALTAQSRVRLSRFLQPSTRPLVFDRVYSRLKPVRHLRSRMRAARVIGFHNVGAPFGFVGWNGEKRRLIDDDIVIGLINNFKRSSGLME